MSYLQIKLIKIKKINTLREAVLLVVVVGIFAFLFSLVIGYLLKTLKSSIGHWFQRKESKAS